LYQTQEPKDRTLHSFTEFPYASAPSVTPNESGISSAREIDHYKDMPLSFTEEKIRNKCSV